MSFCGLKIDVHKLRYKPLIHTLLKKIANCLVVIVKNTMTKARQLEAKVCTFRAKDTIFCPQGQGNESLSKATKLVF